MRIMVFFSISSGKHKLCVHIRSASAMILRKIRKYQYFLIEKVPSDTFPLKDSALSRATLLMRNLERPVIWGHRKSCDILKVAFEM